MKQVFRARDGKIFELAVDACNHEGTLFEAWLATNPSVPAQAVVDAQGIDMGEWYDIEGEFAKNVFRTYWETLDDADALV